MCFSATASFASAALMGAVGLYTISRVSDRHEWPLASMPLFFAAQQSIEGGLWLALPSGGSEATFLSNAFLVFALVFWPVYAPFATCSIEPDSLRRRMIAACLVVGAGVAVYFLWALATTDHRALLADGHIRYDIGDTPVSVGGAYLVATTMGLLLASRRAVAALGLVVLAGAIVSYIVYADTFISVWCFFAAVASVLIASHFRLTAVVRRAPD